MAFDFLVPRRPVSGQTKNHRNKQIWKLYVETEARKVWNGEPWTGIDIELSLIYLCREDPVDTDNIIKPIQDALLGVVYSDDVVVSDVSAHRRSLTGVFDLTRCPARLIEGIIAGEECVYVRVREAGVLEDYL
jgi:hypothetical protein